MKDEDVDRALAAYEAVEPPPDFAARVARRIDAERAAASEAPVHPQRARRGRVVAAVAAAAAAFALVALALLGARSDATTATGTFASRERASLSLGARGVVVAEPGAELRWTVQRSGAARVIQGAGAAFYRVEPGGPFVVETPAGTVEVKGTCFRVEVETMKVSRQSLVAAGIGAALATTVVVTVYEGRVHLAGARGSVTLAPGQRGRLDSGAAAALVPDTLAASAGPAVAEPGPDATRDELRQANASSRRELEAARGRLALLEQQVQDLTDGPDGASPVEPSKTQLAAWATRCEIHIDAPDVFGATASHLDDRDAASWGLTEDERPAVDRALAEVHEQAATEMRAIYLAATGNSAGADELSPSAMFMEISSKSLPADEMHARDRMARERAGLVPPPADLTALPAIERALRLTYRLGNDFEAALAKSLTPSRVHELRKHNDGWPGVRWGGSGCEERTR